MSGHFVTARGKITIAMMVVDNEGTLEDSLPLAILGCAFHSTFSVFKGKEEKEEEVELVMVEGNEEEKDRVC